MMFLALFLRNVSPWLLPCLTAVKSHRACCGYSKMIVDINLAKMLNAFSFLTPMRETI